MPDIKGYRELSEEEISDINLIKEEGIRLGKLVQAMRDTESCDQRWVSVGATELQKGLMSLTRAIAKPETF